jgi:hypothetical protein
MNVVCRGLNPFEIFNEVFCLLIRETEIELPVVVLNDLRESGEPPIMVEAAFLMSPKPSQGRRAVHMGRRAVSLKRVDPYLVGRVQIVSWLGEERRNMARCTLRRPVKESFADHNRAQ